MGNQKNTKIRILLTLLVVLGFSTPAYAYLDPGTGSLILQTVVALFLGAVFTAKLWWGRLKMFFTKRSSAKRENDDQQK